MELTRVATETDARRWQDVREAAYAADFLALPADPLAETLVRLVDTGAAGRRYELWLGTEDGAPVCAADLSLPTLDNLDQAHVEVTVHPAARRRGLGAAALHALTGRCRELGRTLLTAQVPGPLDGGPSAGRAYATAHGFAERLADVRRLLDVATVDDAELDRLDDDAWPRAEGYALLPWVDRAPAHVVDGLADLAGRMSTDAPQGDLEQEPEAWDAARWRASEDDAVARNRLRVGTLATLDGEVVAYTDIGVNLEVPEVGYQWTTIVRSDHRGHRLGLLLKTANLRLLHERSPATRWVNTWNAAENGFMIAINEAVGYRPVDAWGEWQRRL